MPANTTIMYANIDDEGLFDLNYYISTHMALVVEKWVPFGLLGWQVLKFVAPEGAEKPKYSIMALCTWETLEGAAKAIAAPESKVVFEDSVNFSQVKPVHHYTAIVEGSWQKGQ
ncbi:hypothetical protein DL95DRAFT_398898 [Leptodontidium sp. 2 PMI_412]|nr:hypothetical protein DL95DRAFT_398898 [Leptodontidium sp. 2 PMI_412]